MAAPAPSPMTPLTPAEIEALVSATARTLDLPLAAEHRPGVLAYFALAAGMAELVNAQPLTVEDEPANVFTPVAPRDGSA